MKTLQKCSLQTFFLLGKTRTFLQFRTVKISQVPKWMEMLDPDKDPDPNIVNSDPQPFWDKINQPEFQSRCRHLVRCSQHTFSLRGIHASIRC
jgi:hypothetical protein